MLQRAVQRVPRGPRKRSLPIGVRHSRHQVTLSPAHVKRLRQRVAASRAAGVASSFSGEIGRCVDEADGNVRSVRHAVRQPLNRLRMQIAVLRQMLVGGEAIEVEDLEMFDSALREIAERLEPEHATCSTTGPSIR